MLLISFIITYAHSAMDRFDRARNRLDRAGDWLDRAGDRSKN